MDTTVTIALPAADAAELAETLQLIHDWLGYDHDLLDPSLRLFIGHHGYNLDQLQADLNRLTRRLLTAGINTQR